MAREKWSSTLGFILASIGSAVGLGNIWRFPYIMGENGGGAFLIPYLIAIFAVGMPLMMLEFALGRHYRSSVLSVFSSMSRRFRIGGLFLVFIQSVILSYYLTVMGWVLAYFLLFVIGISIPFSTFTLSYYPVAFFLLAALLTLLVVSLGIKGGIERISKYLIPMLVVITIALATYAVSLQGAMDGIRFYLMPDFSKLADSFVWASAFGQSFFSLSVGTGIMLTYGSYMGSEKIPRSSALIAVSDVAISLLAGFTIFPIVFSFGFDPASGAQLVFVTLVTIFQQMSFGNLIGAVFFLLLFFAAMTSAVSMLEVPVSALMDAYKFQRKRAVLISSTLIVLMGVPSALSYTALQTRILGVPVLDLYDLLFGTIGIIAAGLVLSLVAGWFVSRETIMDQIGGSPRTQRIYMFIIKFLIPLILIIVLAVRILQQL